MWTEALGAAALAATLPGTTYLAALTAAALRRPAATQAAREDRGAALRLVVVVPAHNESSGLRRTLDSLAQETRADARARVVVVADNCDDDTAQVARAAGLQVLERHDPARRGKGHALHHAFERIDDADWFAVIDADTDVEPGWLAAMRRGMAAGADALQCRYGVRDPLANRRSALADVALGGWNVVRPRGRAAIGLSAGILGNGFALSRRTLQRVPYVATSIVEDVEYHQLLVEAGLRVRWVDDACVRGDMAPRRPAAAQQRARWEGGRLRLLADRAPALAAAVLRGRVRMLEPLLDLLLLPLAWHVLLLVLALASGGATVQGLALAGVAVVALHVGLALWLIGARREHLRALLAVPLYLLWKLSLLGATLRASRRRAAWVRTTRHPSPP
jgi:cellulose synthase/poly-beta-1,6-N-acetylglucosamine synthase-like glycosyltransferase